MTRIKKLKVSPSDEIFETIVRDGTGREIASWKVRKKDFPDAVRKLNEQFGLGIEIIDKRKPTDLDWLKDQ